MTALEFNDKYDYYLEDGHYGLVINDEDVIEYLDIIFEDLTDISTFKYFQIKTKFNYVCFYSTLTNELNRTIEKKIQEILDNNKK